MKTTFSKDSLNYQLAVRAEALKRGYSKSYRVYRKIVDIICKGALRETVRNYLCGEMQNEKLS